MFLPLWQECEVRCWIPFADPFWSYEQQRTPSCVEKSTTSNRDSNTLEATGLVFGVHRKISAVSISGWAFSLMLLVPINWKGSHFLQSYKSRNWFFGYMIRLKLDWCNIDQDRDNYVKYRSGLPHGTTNTKVHFFLQKYLFWSSNNHNWTTLSRNHFLIFLLNGATFVDWRE
jgi:hypothetical protein